MKSEMLQSSIFDNLGRSSPGGSRDMMYIILAAFLVGCVFAIWAIFIRKRRRGSSNFGHRHRHQKHRRHLPRNPTLAQTGGLPPVRPAEQVTH